MLWGLGVSALATIFVVERLNPARVVAIAVNCNGICLLVVRIADGWCCNGFRGGYIEREDIKRH